MIAQIAFEHWQTQNGVRVFFVAAPDNPILDAQLTFDAGSARDGQLYGAAHFTNSMLSEGTDKINADDLSNAFCRRGRRIFTRNIA